MTFRQTDGPAVAAAKASISTATAYRYEHSHQLPSSQKQTRGRRRPDPLADFFDTEVVPMLKAAPDLRAVAIFRRDAAAPSGLVDRGTSYARAPYPAVNAAILVIDDARAVIDGREQHQRRFAAAWLNPERGLDLFQVGRAHVEVPELVGALGLETHRGNRAHHARMVETGGAQDAIDRLSRPAGARTRPSGVSTPSSSSNRIARAVERWRPFLFAVLILSAATISA